MARACGSYPQCPRFKSRCRYQNPKDGAAVFWDFPFSGSTPLGQPGPLVKWLRHRPFTAVTRVRVPYGSPIWRRSSAGRALASHARGHRFEFCRLHQEKSLEPQGFEDFSFCLAFGISRKIRHNYDTRGRRPEIGTDSISGLRHVFRLNCRSGFGTVQ